ncbi:MAG TPA: hypothetical protein VKU41_04975 [Polyangiaceae bacterium]|nr:hypothetical protein [Polyangiaceae bacterium]
MRTSARHGTLLIALMGTVACLSGGSSRPSVAGSGGASAGAAQGPAGCKDSALGNSCFLPTVGVRGKCMDTSACAALGAHVATPGRCSGPANIACCTSEPRYEDHAPAGYKLLAQPRVTSEMVAWAAMIVDSSSIYCMGSTTQQTFGGIPVMARVEWHPPEPGHGAIHRGVTLYEPDHGPAATAGM